MKSKFRSALALVLSFATVMCYSAPVGFADTSPASDPGVSTGQTQTVYYQLPEAGGSGSTDEKLNNFKVTADKDSVVGGTEVTVTPSDLPDGYTVEWSSSDEAVATVSNGTVTTKSVDSKTSVTITATAKKDGKEASASTTIEVRPEEVTSVKISGQKNERLIKGNTETLIASTTPSGRKIVWSSSDENALTVDQNGNVKAVYNGKGVKNVTITAKNEESGVYASVTYKVYSKAPESFTMKVWVTNENENEDYDFWVPSDGASVDVADVVKETIEAEKRIYHSNNNIVRIGTAPEQPIWSDFQDNNIYPIATKFRYSKNRLEYSSNGNSWNPVNGKNINAFYNFERADEFTGDYEGIKLNVGDWPVDSYSAENNKQLTVKLFDSNGNLIKECDPMFFYKESNQEDGLGKVVFNFDQSRYKLDKVNIEYKDSNQNNATNEWHWEYTDGTIYTGEPDLIYETADGREVVRKEIFLGYYYWVYKDNGKRYRGEVSEHYVDEKGVEVTRKPGSGNTEESTQKSIDITATELESNGVRYYGPKNELKTVNTPGISVNFGKQNKDGISYSTDVNNYQRYTINAYISPKTLNIKYNADGNIPTPAAENVPDNATVSAIADGYTISTKVPTKTGYIFEGWMYNNRTYQPGNRIDLPVTDVTFTAAWIPVNKAIQYKAEEGGRVTNSFESIISGETPAGSTAIANDGYEFDGWVDKDGKPAGTKATIKPGSPAAGEESVVYTAKFKKVTKELTITAGSQQWTYDGDLHYADNDKLTVTYGGEAISPSAGKLTSGKALVLTKNSVKNVADGEQPTIAESVKVIDCASDGDVTSQYNPKVTNGTVKITPRQVTLTSQDLEKEYDGTALTNGDTPITVSDPGFVKGEGAAYTFTGSQTEAGHSDNAFKYKLNDNTKAGNYNIDTKFGTLTVTDRKTPYEITVRAKSDEVTYDGTEHKVSGLESDTITLKENGKVYTVSGLTAEAKGTDAGTYENKVGGTPKVTDENEKDVTKQFTVKTEDGQLVINKRNVTLTSQDLEKEYDGTALTNGDKPITVSDPGFVKGEGAAYTFTGSQTAVGSSENAFTYTLNENTKADNYEIKQVEGTLTVTPIVIFDANGGKYSDGTEKLNKSLEKDRTVSADGVTPTRDGYTFTNKWYTDKDGKTEYDFNNQKPITNNLTLYAGWTKNSTPNPPTPTQMYTLKYETNGGNEIASETYVKGKEVTLTKEPTRRGFSFTGWYSDPDLKNAVTSVIMNSDKTVYAGWKSSVPEILDSNNHEAYVAGYEDGSVKPMNNITREETAAIIFRLLDGKVRNDNLVETNSFDDVLDTRWSNVEISTLESMQIIRGRSAGEFDPSAPITRAEFASMFARMSTVTASDLNIKADKFSDIDGHWAAADINKAVALGWISGYPDGTFHPDAYITRAEAMTLINSVLQRAPISVDRLLTGITWTDNTDPSAWYYISVQEATNSHEYDRSDLVAPDEKWTKIKPAPDWDALRHKVSDVDTED